MTKCKVCGRESRYVCTILDREWDPDPVYSCPGCGLLFVGGEITNDHLAQVYAKIDFDQYYQEIGASNEVKVGRAVKDLKLILPGCASEPSVLDLGCGFGHFCEAMRDNFPGLQVFGHEFTDESARACRSKGFTVFTGGLSEIGRRFCVITLLDVAEHVPFPDRTFAECRSLLPDDGYLYIHTPRWCFWDSVFIPLVKVPGLNRPARAWLRTRVSIFHLQLWTDRALKLCLEKAGFEVVYLKPELELSWPVQRYVQEFMDKKFSLPRFVGRLTTILADLILVRLGTLRNKAVCLARKKPVAG